MKKLVTTLSVVAISFLNASAVLADGVYTPYEPHTPVDTGLETGFIYVAAVTIFALGMLFLATAKTLKKKLS